jgi:alpha-amylase
MKKGRGYDAYDLWDLGEFNQKGSVETRWGTKDELLHASEMARQHGIDILIDAVLNVCLYIFLRMLMGPVTYQMYNQHKLGADRLETFRAVPVDPNNRMKEIGRERVIDVSGT